MQATNAAIAQPAARKASALREFHGERCTRIHFLQSLHLMPNAAAHASSAFESDAESTQRVLIDPNVRSLYLLS